MPKKTVTEPKPRKTTKAAAKAVKFNVSAPHAKEVRLAGDFNHWNPTDILLKGNKKTGVWSVSVKLQPGRYEYKFIVDGQWWTDPNCPHWIWNEHGSHNSVLEV